MKFTRRGVLGLGAGALVAAAAPKVLATPSIYDGDPVIATINKDTAIKVTSSPPKALWPSVRDWERPYGYDVVRDALD